MNPNNEKGPKRIRGGEVGNARKRGRWGNTGHSGTSTWVHKVVLADSPSQPTTPTPGADKVHPVNESQGFGSTSGHRASSGPWERGRKNQNRLSQDAKFSRRSRCERPGAHPALVGRAGASPPSPTHRRQLPSSCTVGPLDKSQPSCRPHISHLARTLDTRHELGTPTNMRPRRYHPSPPRFDDHNIYG